MTEKSITFRCNSWEALLFSRTFWRTFQIRPPLFCIELWRPSWWSTLPTRYRVEDRRCCHRSKPSPFSPLQFEHQDSLSLWLPLQLVPQDSDFERCVLGSAFYQFIITYIYKYSSQNYSTFSINILLFVRCNYKYWSNLLTSKIKINKN